MSLFMYLRPVPLSHCPNHHISVVHLLHEKPRNTLLLPPSEILSSYVSRIPVFHRQKKKKKRVPPQTQTTDSLELWGTPCRSSSLPQTPPKGMTLRDGRRSPPTPRSETSDNTPKRDLNSSRFKLIFPVRPLIK